jgi:hypothetical protein
VAAAAVVIKSVAKVKTAAKIKSAALIKSASGAVKKEATLVDPAMLALSRPLPTALLQRAMVRCMMGSRTVCAWRCWCMHRAAAFMAAACLSNLHRGRKIIERLAGIRSQNWDLEQIMERPSRQFDAFAEIRPWFCSG